MEESLHEVDAIAYEVGASGGGGTWKVAPYTTYFC